MTHSPPKSKISDFASIVRTCAEAGKKLAQEIAMAGGNVRLSLYYKPSVPERAGDLVLVAQGEQPPSGYELACDEQLRGNVAFEAYHRWVAARSTRLPILA